MVAAQGGALIASWSPRVTGLHVRPGLVADVVARRKGTNKTSRDSLTGPSGAHTGAGAGVASIHGVSWR